MGNRNRRFVISGGFHPKVTATPSTGSTPYPTRGDYDGSCLRQCVKAYEPVCDQNEFTHDSECMFLITACRHPERELRIAYEGECEGLFLFLFGAVFIQSEIC